MDSFPGGNYYNSSKITPGFFDDKPKSDRVAKLVNEDMPFLYNLLKSKLQRNQTAEKVNFGDSDSGDESDGPTRKSAPPIPVREATPMDPSATDDILNDDNTNGSIKKTPQAEEWEGEIYDRADRSHIQNAVVLLACGVTERVNMFLNYIGLSSSRRTAHRAIQALGKLAEKKILRIMLDDTAVLAPIICIDNIDFEESVHDNDFSLEKYHQSILDSATMPLKPSFFLPTQKTSYHFKPSQESDNTRNGEVFEGIIRQTGLTATEFYSKLRVFKGDLGTCMNLESLRMQQKPSGHIENSLSSIFTLLGASHILWNVAQAVYLMHYGNYSDSNDLGAWQTLSALGLSAERPTTKKDFSLMMTHLTKCHEASILYCLLTVMGYPKALLPKDRVSMPSQKLKEIVNDCYSQFFSPEAFDALDDEESDSSDKGSDAIDDSDCGSGSSEHSEKAKDSPVPGLKNLLLRLRDFALIVEWLAHSTEALPFGLPKRTGNHFVGKDFYLENQNYWLKYFFNHNGIGTKIDRLKELHELVQGLRADAGKNIILQSHKHDISNQSLNNFLQMAHQHDILSNLTMQKKKTTDIYDAGREALKEDFRKDSRKLNRMQPSTILLYHTPTGPLEDEAPIDESALENECEMGD
ncbi:hypothetical protein PSTT_11420 [Puccinia striiformis]|uniref:DUF6589 domain-containing protein n=1 Tax=Puccinia striiformis TaxID=27350 RepID=A0A2S4V0D1_9BASI|nr:hypothetical protein PSTT_11420 [Puccinia striiformis]